MLFYEHSKAEERDQTENFLRQSDSGPEFYLGAADSFRQSLEGLEKQGRKDSPEWHLAYGLHRLAQGLQRDHEEEEDRGRSFARRWVPIKQLPAARQ